MQLISFKMHAFILFLQIKLLKISPDSKNNDDIVKFMREHFPDEPLNRAFGITPNDDVYKFLEQQDLQTIKDGLSLKAVDSETGKVWNIRVHLQMQGDPDLSLKLKDVTKEIQIIVVVPVDSYCAEIASVGALD